MIYEIYRPLQAVAGLKSYFSGQLPRTGQTQASNKF